MSENREISKDMKKSAADQDLAWEEVSVEHIVQDKWIDFRRATYRFPDGTTFSPYYNYSRRSYVVIVASDEEENYLCVRQYRHGIGQVTTEFVAGGIESSTGREYITADDARTTHEDALTAAKRELEEETGYTSDEWEHRRYGCGQLRLYFQGEKLPPHKRAAHRQHGVPAHGEAQRGGN